MTAGGDLCSYLVDVAADSSLTQAVLAVTGGHRLASARRPVPVHIQRVGH